MEEKKFSRLAEVYKNDADDIKRYIFFKVNNYELAEDLFQDVLVLAMRYIQKRNKISNMRNFLFIIAKNKVIDYYRQKYKIPVPLDELGLRKLKYTPRIEDEIDQKIQLRKLNKLLSQIDNMHKQILSFRYSRELSINEISELTGKSPNHVSVLIYQGVKMIKKKINK